MKKIITLLLCVFLISCTSGVTKEEVSLAVQASSEKTDEFITSADYVNKVLTKAEIRLCMHINMQLMRVSQRIVCIDVELKPQKDGSAKGRVFYLVNGELFQEEIQVKWEKRFPMIKNELKIFEILRRIKQDESRRNPTY